MKLLSLIPGLGDTEAYTQMYGQTGELIKVLCVLKRQYLCYLLSNHWWANIVTNPVNGEK